MAIPTTERTEARAHSLSSPVSWPIAFVRGLKGFPASIEVSDGGSPLRRAQNWACLVHPYSKAGKLLEAEQEQKNCERIEVGPERSCLRGWGLQRSGLGIAVKVLSR